MRYSKEEHLEIGQKIHESGLSNLNASITFGISEESARRYRSLYRQSQGIENDSSRAHIGPVDTTAIITPGEPASTSDDYSSMTRKELIEELMKSKIREARLKKDIW